MLLTGTFSRAVDEKLRVRDPQAAQRSAGCPGQRAYCMSRQARTDHWLFTRRMLWPSWLGVWLKPRPTPRTCGPSAACSMRGHKPSSWMARGVCEFRPNWPLWPVWEKKPCSSACSITWNCGNAAAGSSTSPSGRINTTRLPRRLSEARFVMENGNQATVAGGPIHRSSWQVCPSGVRSLLVRAGRSVKRPPTDRLRLGRPDARSAIGCCERQRSDGARGRALQAPTSRAHGSARHGALSCARLP